MTSKSRLGGEDVALVSWRRTETEPRADVSKMPKWKVVGYSVGVPEDVSGCHVLAGEHEMTWTLPSITSPVPVSSNG